MLRVRHLATALATTIVATLVAVVLPAPTAQAVVGEYVALGDSYASGVGTREYLEESADCRRSPHAYPVDQAARLGAPLSFQACSGAVVAGVRSAQLGMLDGGTGYVSVQVGGYDAGFSSVITECAKPAWAQDCVGAVEDARAIINGELPGRLAGLYSDISARAPTATVLVVGYPRLFHDEDCNAGTFFSPADRQLLNDTADVLNDRLDEQALAAGSRSWTPPRRFSGMRSATNRKWINGAVQSGPRVVPPEPRGAGRLRRPRRVRPRLSAITLGWRHVTDDLPPAGPVRPDRQHRGPGLQRLRRAGGPR